MSCPNKQGKQEPLDLGALCARRSPLGTAASASLAGCPSVTQLAWQGKCTREEILIVGAVQLRWFSSYRIKNRC